MKKLVAVMAVLVLLLIMLRWLEKHLIYIPSRHMAAAGTELARPVEDVFFNARDDVRLNAWFFPARTNASRRHLVFLLLHGNAGNISHRLEIYRACLELGVNVLALDYRGYGRSEGRPDEEGTYLDAQAACQWLRQKGFASPQIIALGESLGGGVASELALRERLGGLVLQSTFTNIPDLGGELYPWLPVRWLTTIRYDTCAKLTQVDIPVLVLHSREDRMVAFHHAEKNYEVARKPKMLWELRGDHNDTLVAGRARYLEGLEKYLGQHFPPETP